MKRYLASFHGRTKGALGIRYNIETIVEAEDKEKARIRLYDNYEHITGLILTELL